MFYTNRIRRFNVSGLKEEATLRAYFEEVPTKCLNKQLSSVVGHFTSLSREHITI